MPKTFAPKELNTPGNGGMIAPWLAYYEKHKTRPIEQVFAAFLVEYRAKQGK